MRSNGSWFSTVQRNKLNSYFVVSPTLNQIVSEPTPFWFMNQMIFVKPNNEATDLWTKWFMNHMNQTNCLVFHHPLASKSSASNPLAAAPETTGIVPVSISQRSPCNMNNRRNKKERHLDSPYDPLNMGPWPQFFGVTTPNVLGSWRLQAEAKPAP